MASTTNASAVSRYLRQHDVVVLPSGTAASHKGVRVTQSRYTGEVSIHCALEPPRHAEWVAEAIREILTQGPFAVRPNVFDASILYVTKEH